LAAFFTSHTWPGNVLHISSIGCEGAVFVKDNYLTARLRFDRFGLANLAPYLKDKVLSEVAAATVEVAGSTPFGSKDLFIIHGHGDAARLQLKTLLSSFGLNPIVLAEMNDGGMTVIEKFEYYARLCSFAVALMTPDDQILGSKDPESQWRARPNVILELGWFMARLGRDRVLLFSQGDLDIPSESVMEVAPQLSGCRTPG